MTARILRFPSGGHAADIAVGQVVEIVRLCGTTNVQLNHESGSRDHVAALPAKPRHACYAKLRAGLGVGKSVIPLPLAQLGRRSLHNDTGNTLRYNLTIASNAIRRCAMSATILSFARMEDMPNRILELRRAAGLSQEELAFQIGVSKMQISGMERGKRELTLTMMRKLADALGVDTVDILARADNPTLLDDSTRRIIATFNRADPDQRENIARVTEALAAPSIRDRSAA